MLLEEEMVFELGDESCYPKALVAVNVALAFIDGIIGVLAFYQLIRIHTRSSRVGWTRQKVFHLMIGSSNLGYFVYFVLTLVAACKDWLCWSNSCGFIVMACPKILFLAAFLLLLSFWVDLCHQTNDDEEDEEGSPREALLERTSNKPRSNADSHRRCCSFRAIHVGSRQKVVIVVTLLFFVLMMGSAVLIWIGMGKNPIDSSVVARADSRWSSRFAFKNHRRKKINAVFSTASLRNLYITIVYVGLFAIAILLLGGALACYGLLLFLKMSKVRSERTYSEMWKVAGLAVVSVVCFTSSAFVALLTNIPVLYQWHQENMNGVYTSLLLILYYFIGSSVPSAFVLWVMRELPPSVAVNVREESRTIAFVTDSSVIVHPHRWTAATSSQNQVSRASPI